MPHLRPRVAEVPATGQKWRSGWPAPVQVTSPCLGCHVDLQLFNVTCIHIHRRQAHAEGATVNFLHLAGFFEQTCHALQSVVLQTTAGTQCSLHSFTCKLCCIHSVGKVSRLTISQSSCSTNVHCEHFDSHCRSPSSRPCCCQDCS